MTGEVARATPQEVIEAVQPDADGLLEPSTDSWIATVAEVAKLARYIASTEFVPKGLRGNPAGTTAAILYGRELGVPPMTALQVTNVIEGRVGMAAEMLRAMVLAAGHEIETLDTTAAQCRMRGRRAGRDTWTNITWTLGDAQKAGLANRGTWKNYPRQMLQARCSAELCRLVFPDVIRGMAAWEELDADDIPAPVDTAPATTAARVQRKPRRTKAVKPAPAVSAPPPADEPPLDEPAGQQLRREIGEHLAGQPLADEPPLDDAPAAAPAADEPVPSSDPDPGGELPITRQQSKKMHALLRDLEITDRTEGLAELGAIAGRDLSSSNELTVAEAAHVIDELQRRTIPTAEPTPPEDTP